MPDFGAVAGCLPAVQGKFDDVPLLAVLDAALAEYETAPSAERERILARLADVVSQDPWTLLHVLLSERFAAHRQSEGYLCAVAYLYFLIGRLADAMFLSEAAFSQGARRAFVLDLIVRILIERREWSAAQAALAENRDLMEGQVALLGRAAALLFLEGRADEANELARTVRRLYHKDMRDKVNHRMDDILLMEEKDRTRFHPEVTDIYLNARNQAQGWWQYHYEMSGRKSRYRNDSMFVNAAYRDAIEDAIGRSPGLKVIVNFGALFGINDYELAKAHPGLLFVAYDRAPVARHLNEQWFQSDNLTFLDGEFVDAVEPRIIPGHTLLGHCRTATLMYPEVLERFYGQCRTMGVERIVAGEFVNYSEVDGCYPDFRASNRHALLMGGHMIHHDYDHVLAGAGFTPTHRRFHPVTCHQPSDSHGKVFFAIFQVIEAQRRA